MKLKPRRIHQKTVHDASLMHPTSAYAPYGLARTPLLHWRSPQPCARKKLTFLIGGSERIDSSEDQAVAA